MSYRCNTALTNKFHSSAFQSSTAHSRAVKVTAGREKKGWCWRDWSGVSSSDETLTKSHTAVRERREPLDSEKLQNWCPSKETQYEKERGWRNVPKLENNITVFEEENQSLVNEIREERAKLKTLNKEYEEWEKKKTRDTQQKVVDDLQATINQKSGELDRTRAALSAKNSELDEIAIELSGYGVI